MLSNGGEGGTESGNYVSNDRLLAAENNTATYTIPGQTALQAEATINYINS